MLLMNISSSMVIFESNQEASVRHMPMKAKMTFHLPSTAVLALSSRNLWQHGPSCIFVKVNQYTNHI